MVGICMLLVAVIVSSNTRTSPGVSQFQASQAMIWRRNIEQYLQTSGLEIGAEYNICRLFQRCQYAFTELFTDRHLQGMGKLFLDND